MRNIIVASIVLIVAGVLIFSYSMNKSAWSTALLWSGINSLPTWASDKTIEAKGSMFTREFVITFTGTSAQIEEWTLNESAFRNISKEQIDKSNYRFVLKPQGGAQWAEVNINLIHKKITIRTYWS